MHSATKAADAYLNAIRAHGDAPYDREFMQQTFDDFWHSVMKYVVAWNNMLLRGMPGHIIPMLLTANEVQAVRKRFVEGFNNPADYFDWLATPQRAADYLEEVAPERIAAGT